jgi:hypothetical protein
VGDDAGDWPGPGLSQSLARWRAPRAVHDPGKIVADLAGAVAAFNDSQLAEQDRARRAGRRQLSDITLEGRLRILRDLARRLAGGSRL